MMIIIYGHRIWSSNTASTYDHHIWVFFPARLDAHTQDARSQVSLSHIWWSYMMLSSMMIIYDRHLWWSYMMIKYDHHKTIIEHENHIRSPNMMIICDHHIWSFYTIIRYDHHIWHSDMIISDMRSSYMVIMCDHHKLYDGHIWSSYTMIIYDHHVWRS